MVEYLTDKVGSNIKKKFSNLKKKINLNNLH